MTNPTANQREAKSRRATGEGSIHRRADGRWAASYELGWAGNGRRLRKTVYGSTQREVADKLRAIRRQVEQGIVPTPEKYTVAAFLSDWLKAVEPTLRPRTFKRYSEVVQHHLIPGVGKHKLSQLGPHHVEAFLAERGKASRRRQANTSGSPSLSPRTVQEIRTVLVVALNKALRWGLVPRNVAALADGPRVPHQEIRPLTAEQARQMLTAARGHRLEALFVAAVSSGARQGELLALTWSDVDFDTATIHIRRALQRVDRAYRLVETKTARSRRSIALPDVAIRALRDHRRRQIEERLAGGARWDDGWGLVFCTRDGRPLYGPAVTGDFQEMLQKAGLPRQRFHDLRHACASLLLAQGVDLKVIQELLGHSTIAVTANTYSHVMGNLKRDAASRMDAVFRAAGEAR